jgi:predicted tellurium resistance membrane protein TerC
VFVGAKMLFEEVVHIPIAASLLVIAAILGTSVVASLRRAPEPVANG